MNNAHEISLLKAIEMTQAYKNDPVFSGQTTACRISNSAYNEIISQSNCSSIRTYFGKNENGVLTIVLVGVDEFGNDIINGKIMNMAETCPPYCSENSAL